MPRSRRYSVTGEYRDLLKEIARLETQLEHSHNLAAEAWQDYGTLLFRSTAPSPQLDALKSRAILLSEQASKVGDRWVAKLDVKRYMLGRHQHLSRIAS